jgi:hypothetical protein
MDALTQRFLDRSGATKIMEAELTRAAEMTRMKAEQIGKAFNDGLTQSFGIGGWRQERTGRRRHLRSRTRQDGGDCPP